MIFFRFLKLNIVLFFGPFLQSVNKKYDNLKKIIVQMEEKLMMSLQQPQSGMGHATCSPDTDRTGEYTNWPTQLCSIL